MIDAGGRDNAALRAALILSDTVLVPFQPRSVDVWALGAMAELVEEAKTFKPDLRAYAILNGADPSPTSSDNIDAATAAADYPQLDYLKTIAAGKPSLMQPVWGSLLKRGCRGTAKLAPNFRPWFPYCLQCRVIAKYH